MSSTQITFEFEDAESERRFLRRYMVPAWERFEEMDAFESGWFWRHGRFGRHGIDGLEEGGYSAYDWNTIAMSRSIAGRSFITRPSRRISPSVIDSNPAIIRSVVDLPQPEGPTRTRNSPSSMSIDTSSTATISVPSRSVNTFDTWSSSVLAMSVTSCRVTSCRSVRWSWSGHTLTPSANWSANRT